MIEYLAAIAVFSLWFSLWLLLRAEARLLDQQNKAELESFKRDYK